MKKYFLLVLILTFSIPTFSKKKKEKTKFPDEYEVFQSGDWELDFFIGIKTQLTVWCTELSTYET